MFEPSIFTEAVAAVDEPKYQLNRFLIPKLGPDGTDCGERAQTPKLIRQLHPAFIRSSHTQNGDRRSNTQHERHARASPRVCPHQWSTQFQRRALDKMPR
jgi:hypothetical protein